MTACPNCAATLELDFGMVTCPSCSAMLFIDMEGLAHLSASEESAMPEAPAFHDLDLGREFVAPAAYDKSLDDPLGLNAFANSELSTARDGPLLYRIVISGIDSKEMRENIREAMTDSRFGWDVGALLSRIVKGHLTIENVAPVKASVLVNRLKRLPVTIQWEQHAVSQLEAPESQSDV